MTRSTWLQRKSRSAVSALFAGRTVYPAMERRRRRAVRPVGSSSTQRMTWVFGKKLLSQGTSVSSQPTKNRPPAEKHDTCCEPCRCSAASPCLPGSNDGRSQNRRGGPVGQTSLSNSRSGERSKTFPRLFTTIPDRCHPLKRRLAVNVVTFAAFAKSSLLTLSSTPAGTL